MVVYDYSHSSTFPNPRDASNSFYTTRHYPAELEASQGIALHDMTMHKQKHPDMSSPSRGITGPLWGVLVAGLVCGNLLISMDNTIVADIQTPLILDLGDYTNFPWVAVGYSLGAVSVNLFWGQLHRLFDKKLLFILAILIFEAGSIVCGAALTLKVLIVGRVICGLGGTGVYIGIMNIISALTTPQERAFYISLPGAAWAIGAIIGPVIGGAIGSSKVGWRWCFWINLIVGGAWAPVYVFLLPSIPTMVSLSFARRLRKLDILGLILFACSFSALIMGISFGGTLLPWNSRGEIGFFVAASIGFVLLATQQMYAIFCHEEYRLFPIHYLKSKDMCILFSQVASGMGGVWFLSLYFIPLYFQFVQGVAPLTSGARLLPFICFGIVFLLVNGAVMGRTGLYMPWFAVGGILVVVGAALMHTINVDSSASLVYGFSILMGAGAGCYAQAPFSIAQAKVPPKDIPVALAFIGCGQITGITLAFSIGYSVFINSATNQISALLPLTSSSDIQQAIIGVNSKVLETLPTDTRMQVLVAVNNSIRNVWIQILAAGALTFVLAVFMKRERFIFKK